MTPEELYGMTPELVDHDLDILKWDGSHHNHVPELQFEEKLPFTDPNKRISIKYYKKFQFDQRRYWALASVWFKHSWLEDSPFMIIQNAGREGDDHSERFITHMGIYELAIAYLRSICTISFDESTKRIVSALDDIPNLTKFYGDELGGYFERHNGF